MCMEVKLSRERFLLRFKNKYVESRGLASFFPQRSRTRANMDVGDAHSAAAEQVCHSSARRELHTSKTKQSTNST